MPLKGLLSDEFAAERRALINPALASTHPAAPGNPWPHNGGGSGGQAGVTATQSETTTHLTVSDRKGTVVSYTFTIESTGGNGIVVPGWGFLLNNEFTDFDFSSLTHPNRVEGGKRPRSSMSPTIVLDRGKPHLALGSPGGSTIITTVIQLLVDRLDLGATLPEAIAAPRATQRNTAEDARGGRVPRLPRGAGLVSTYKQVLALTGEIGAGTGIDFLRDGRVVAAAEPVRRGGGSAMVVPSKRRHD